MTRLLAASAFWIVLAGSVFGQSSAATDSPQKAVQDRPPDQTMELKAAEEKVASAEQRLATAEAALYECEAELEKAEEIAAQASARAEAHAEAREGARVDGENKLADLRAILLEEIAAKQAAEEARADLAFELDEARQQLASLRGADASDSDSENRVAVTDAEARLAEIRQQTGEAEAHQAELAQQRTGLEQQIAKLRQSLGEARQQVADVVAHRDAAASEVAELEARKTEAETALTRTQASEAELRQGLEEATTRQAAATAAALEAERRQAQAEQAYAATQERRASAEAALAETVERLEHAEKSAPPRGTEVIPSAAIPREQKIPPAPVEQAVVPQDAAKPRQVQWSMEQVEAALSRAPALGTGPQRAELQRRLIDGECAPEALKGVYGQINRQALRALIAELGACK